MAGIDNASKFRSKEDEERLRRQKAKAPTDINRARELAKQYSNPHKFDNTVTVTKRIDNEKWYAGDKPTARETYARMFQVAGDDQNKMKELQSQYAQEISNPGSVIYNPYAQATNSKAINGLRELGIDVPDVITDQWVDKMWGQYGQYGRQTTTSYGPSAPTTKSTRENDIAYWVSTLMEDKENTNLAEAQMKSLYDEVAYLTKQGYSDNEIVKRVRNEFGSKYNVLNKMDEERMVGSAVRLNRAVDYSGDDTLYGMIWAARNDGGTGDYFTDAVNYAMGSGKKYKADPTSEAALDPTSPDYNPYGRGGTMHDLQMKYGVTSFSRDWLDKNRATILSDPDGYKDIEKIQGGIEDYENATAELAELDKWVEKQIARGATMEKIEAGLDALIKAGGDEAGLIKVPTLKKMEDKRYAGTYLGLADAVDFTMPGYLDKVADKIAERDAGAAVQEEENEQREATKLGKWLSEAGAGVSRFFASMDIGIGSHGDAIDSVLDAEHGSMSADDMVKKYASSQLGVELTGDLQDGEREIVESVLEQIDAATKFGASKEEREAAVAGIAVLDQLVGQIAADPERRDSYKANESYTSVYDKQPEEPREGMAEMVAEPMAYTGADGQPVDPYSMPEAAAYEKMLQGGEWDTNALGWGYSMSNNPTAVEAELVEGILGIFNGQKPTGLSKSWYSKFSGLMNNTNKAVRPTGLSQGERDIHAANPELYDSRHMYGSQVYDALMANQKALDDGALHPVDYVKNLIVISAAAEAIGEAAGGARATDEQAAEVLAANNGELQAMLDSANDICAQGQEAKAAAEAEVQQKIIGIVDAYAAGEQLDVKSETVMNSILSMDVSKTAANDSTYQDISAQVKDSPSMDNLLRSGMTFTTGDFESDMLMDHADLQQSGALVYGQGVMMVVEDMLDEDMRLASACGMTLGEYYEAHPERARSSEQMLAEAQSRYDTTWNEFGKTISGLTAANQKLEGNEEEAKISTVESLSLKDTIGIIADKFGIQLEADLRKTGHFLNYAWRDQGEKKNALMQQYGNDRTAFAADLNELEKGELTRLQGVYENDASKGDMQFDEWVKQHPEGQNLRELRTMREANVDIFDIGMTVDEIKSGWGIADVTGTMANIDALVEEHGSDADKFIVQSGVSLLNTGLMMATTALGGGGMAGSLAATAANAGASAHDRFQQTGNFDAALWSSVAEWGVNAIIEKIGFDRYMPEGIGGGNLATKMMHSKYILATQNLAQIVRSPESMSKVARGIFAAGIQGFMDAGSEFLEEFSQGIVTAMADNFAYSKPYLLTAKQFGEAAKEGVMAAVTAPILSLASGNKISFSDAAGNLIDSAQALLLPEHDGAILNDAIDFQSTRLAIQNSQDALNQIEQSSENAAKKQAGADLQAANAELAEAQAELATVQEQEASAGAALEAANAEMNSGAPFTEELSKRMVAAAENMNKVREHLAKVQQRVQAASEHQTEAQQKYEDAKAAVQKMYDELMQAAKAEAEQLVTDLFFGGDSEAQRAAMDRYRAACQKLMDAKNNLRIARADSEMFARGTAQGDGLFEYFGEVLLEVEALTEEVAAAKAEVDTAYAATGEGQMRSQQNADLTAAEEAAALAAEKAAASPGNQNLQAQAELAQAQLNAIRAKQTLDEKRTDIGKRLQSPRSTDREAAVQEWNELQQAANDAAAEADRLQAEVDTTDTQKNLRSAIDNMKQYGPMDLIDESSANHEAAMDAYAELQAASADAELEQAVGELNKAMESPENAAGISDAARKVNEIRGRKKDEAEAEVQAPVKHIDDRSVGDAADRRVTPFFNENRDSVKDYALAALTEIENDFGQSMPAERVFIQGGKGNGHGSDQDVIGITRLTSDLIGKYKDARHWSWKQMGDYLSKMRNALENGTTIPNTAAMKHVEAMIDEVLSEGYRTIDGTFIEPSLDYLKYKEATGGRRVDSYVMAQSGVSLYDRHGVGSPITPSFMRAVSDGIRNIAADERTTPAGEHILEIGDKFVYTDGNADNPRISRVITFLYKGVHPDIDAVLKEALYVLEEEGRNQDIKQLRAENLATVSSIFGAEDAFRTYDLEDAGGSEGGAGSGAGGYDRTNGAGGGKQVSPEGNLRYLKTRPDAANSAGDGKVGQNPVEIMRDLTNGIRVGYSPNGPMNEGSRRVSSDVLAFYNEYANGIRVRSKYAGDLAVGLHEFGHAAHARLNGLHATQAMIDAMPDSVKNSYTAREMDGEAIAEFVVQYMYGRDLAVQNAGEQFVRDFERMMRADPELNAAITRGRDQVELWNSAPAKSRAEAMIKDSTTAMQRDKEASKGGAKRVVEKFITQVFDANEPLRKLSKSVYDAAKWSRWASERADVILRDNFVDPESNIVGKGLNARLDEIGFTADMEADAATYGICQIAIERLDQKKPVFAESEFSRADLLGIMKDIKQRNPIAAQGADVLSGFWKDVMDTWLVPSGIVSEDVRDKFWDMYKHYLPTKRVVDVNWSKKDVEAGTFTLHAAKPGGVSMEVINPFQSIVDMTNRAVRSVSRNQVMQEIDAVLQGGGLDWLAKEVPVDQAVTHVDTDKLEEKLRAALDSGSGYDPELVADAFNVLDDLGEQWHSVGRSLKPNVIAGRRADGTAFYYQIQQGNEDMFQAAMSSNKAANAYLRSVKKVVSAFTQLTTQFNPTFAGKNAVRDFFTSMNTGTWAWSYLDGAAKWMWGMYEIATGNKQYQQFEAMGGGSHTRYSTGSEKGLAAIRRDILGAKDKFPVRAAKLGFKIFTLSDINEMIEANSRYVEYRFGRHDKNTFEGRREAAIAAQDVTVDFGMAGANEILQGFLAHVPFGRAALNGVYKSASLIRNLGSNDPATQKNAAIALTKTVVNTGVMAAMQAYLLGALLGGDDDELKQEEYALFTDEVKAGNLLIPMNQDKTNASGYDRPWIRVPLPQDAITRAVFAFSFNQIANGTNMDELSMDMVNVAKTLLTDSLPGEFITTNLSNAMMNRTWYGGQIVSDYLMDSRSGINQYNDNTPSVFKHISNALNNLSRGRWEVSPAVLQYCFEQSTGYVGKVIMPLISGDRYTGEWSMRTAGQNLLYSFAKNFTIDPLTSNNLSKDYKAATTKLSKIVSEAEAGLPIGYLAYSLTDTEREDAYAEAKALQKTLIKATDAELKERWAEIDYIESSETLTNSEKAIQIREVRREIDAITAEAMVELGQYIQTYVDRDPWVTSLLNLFNERPTLE